MSNAFPSSSLFGRDRDHEGVPLSEAGAARREALLPMLQYAVVREAGRRRARRVAVRYGGSLCVIAIAAVSAFVVSRRPAQHVEMATVEPAGSEAGRDDGIKRLTTAPGVLERYAFATSFDPAEYIVDDRGLVETLASIGRPSGLIHRDGRVMLTSFSPDPIRDPAAALPAAQP